MHYIKAYSTFLKTIIRDLDAIDISPSLYCAVLVFGDQVLRFDLDDSIWRSEPVDKRCVKQCMERAELMRNRITIWDRSALLMP
ncbi:MAG: hypothetical protein KF784_11510 [Fimbriimonadaceae bacterium]|nr:hypothetical protein [Fimbriimonadaceae bacterium]